MPANPSPMSLAICVALYQRADTLQAVVIISVCFEIMLEMNHVPKDAATDVCINWVQFLLHVLKAPGM